MHRSITVVVGGCAHEQVGGLHAAWVVAGVADNHAIRDRTVVDHVGDPMGAEVTASVGEYAVAVIVAVRALPGPALVRGWRRTGVVPGKRLGNSEVCGTQATFSFRFIFYSWHIKTDTNIRGAYVKRGRVEGWGLMIMRGR